MIQTTKKKNGALTYRAKVYVDGEQVTKTFRRKQDAQLWKQQMIVDRERGVLKLEKKTCDLSFIDFARQWLETKRHGLRPKSIDAYQTLLALHLIPELGHLKLTAIGMKEGHALIAKLKGEGRSPKGINMIICLLKAIMQDAVRWEILEVSRLQGLQNQKVPPRSAQYWMPEEIQKFLHANRQCEFYELWVVALNTGMRRGELAGLCWDKVDFQNRLIHVCRQRDRHGLQETTKTNSSFRYVPMNEACFDVLQKLHRKPRHKELVFAKRDGDPFDVQHIAERHFRAAIRRAGVPRIRFHDLRATFAANVCMAPDGDLYGLSKILGHSSVDMTTKKYAHLHNSFLKRVASSVNFS